MKLKLRYVFVFALGMACMYWLVRSGALIVTPLIGGDHLPDTTVTGAVSTGSTISTGLSTGSVLMTGAVSTGNSGSIEVQETVALMNQTGMIESTGTVIESTGITTPSLYTKEQACTQPNGTYTIPVQVGRNDVLTASTKGFVKRGNYLHYITYVSNGAKYYFYHNCSNGIATNAQNLTATNVTRVVLTNGQVYLR